MWWVEGHREFVELIHKHYEVELFSKMIRETKNRKGIMVEMFWNPHREYPEVGDYVTDVTAGPVRLTYVGKVVKRYKGKRPHYDVEVIYSYDGKQKVKEKREGYFLAKLEKKNKNE